MAIGVEELSVIEPSKTKSISEILEGMPKEFQDEAARHLDKNYPHPPEVVAFDCQGAPGWREKGHANILMGVVWEWLDPREGAAFGVWHQKRMQLDTIPNSQSLPQKVFWEGEFREVKKSESHLLCHDCLEHTKKK